MATLVAEERTPDEMFAKVLEEVGTLLDDVDSAMMRFESDGTATVLGVRSKADPPDGIRRGIRIPLGGDNVTSMVHRTGRPARIDDYATSSGEMARRSSRHLIRSAVGVPIVVHGRLWGSLVVAARDPRPMPRETEARVAEFTELLGTAIANADARAEVARLADEQAALRRVATLVAQGAAPTDVFAAAAVEVAQLLDADLVALGRYRGGHGHGRRGPRRSRRARSGRHRPRRSRARTSRARSGAPAGRRASTTSSYAAGPIADMVQRARLTASVGAPVIVDGNVWGVIITSWTSGAPPPDTEARLAQFAELLDTAIANADSRAQLTASRLRMMAAEDGARRRVVRDLHDGAQQRLVQTILMLKLVQQALANGGEPIEPLVAEALENVERGHDELRELAHGILPAVLARGRAARRRRHVRRASGAAGHDRAARHALRARARGQRLLRDRRGAHERRQARAGDLRRGAGRARRQPPERRDPRRRHRRRGPRRPRPGRHRRPRHRCSAGRCGSRARRAAGRSSRRRSRSRTERRSELSVGSYSLGANPPLPAPLFEDRQKPLGER